MLRFTVSRLIQAFVVVFAVFTLTFFMVRLAPGDIVMFPRGDGHVLSSAPGMRAADDRSDWRFVTRNDPKPIPVAYHRGVLRPGSAGPAALAGGWSLRLYSTTFRMIS